MGIYRSFVSYCKAEHYLLKCYRGDVAGWLQRRFELLPAPLTVLEVGHVFIIL